MWGVHEGTFLCLSLSGKGPTARSIRTRGSNDRMPGVDDTERRLAEHISTAAPVQTSLGKISCMGKSLGGTRTKTYD